MKHFAIAFALASLAACGGANTPAENSAEALEEAAEQSDPAAREVLENAAERIEDQNGVAPMNEANSAAQEALQHAGEAQTEGRAPAE